MKDRPRQLAEGITVEGISSEGKGISKINGKVIFTEFAVPGDVIDIEIRKSKKNFAEAVITKIQKPSALRVQPVCPHFGVCGGCKWQHIDYAQQLKFKKQIVEDAFNRIGKLNFSAIPEVLGSKENLYYRNKLEFAFTNRRWLTEQEINSGTAFGRRNALGFHVPESFSGVLDIERCYLQADPSNPIRLALRDFALQNNFTFYDLKEHTGFLRNLIIRTASTGEVLVLVSFAENDAQKIERVMEFLKNLTPPLTPLEGESQPQPTAITSLQYVVNTKRNDTIYDLETKVYAGKDHIIEKLGDYQFKIGPKSFFQTNSLQARVLYDVARDFAQLKPSDVVYDLYTGVGSIAIYLSGLCQSVTGIEQVEAAIEDARENARLNNVANCSFHAGDVKMILQGDFLKTQGRPDIIITDPPRAGMHGDVVKTLLQIEAPKIVYVSCNPATQARDLQLLAEKYQVKRVQPVDMFPHTTHIENVVLLEM